MTFCPPRLTPYVDRSVIAQRYPPYHPYHHDSDPESYHHHLPLRVPRPLPALALKLQDPRIKCDRNLGWSIDWAVAFLVDHLDPKNNPDAATVLKAIRQRAAALEREGYALEIPFRIFNTLNNTLFAGHLKNAVYLDIRRLNPDVSGATHTHGLGFDPKMKRISIYLNKNALQQARSSDLIGVLIHHMIHAYFLVACGPQVEKEVGYGRLDHGLHFGKIMMTIKKLSDLDGHTLSSLDFGHTLGQTNGLLHDEYYYQQRKPYHRRRGKEKWYCSHCYSDVAALPENEIDDWYGSICKPLLTLPESFRASIVHIYNPLRHILEEVPRGEATPSTQSNEFLFHDKPVLVPAAHVDAYISVRGAFEKAGSRYLEIPEFVDQDTFLRFLELLHTNSYGPDPKHIYGLGKNGPPVIKNPSTSEPYLLMDIRIYKMGVLMGFEELKAVALDRMYRYEITHEDPVTLLKELYADREPDGELKAWTRKFLGKAPMAGDGEWMGTASLPTEMSNLAKLECDLLGWKPRFYELLEESSALKYEVSKVKRELMVCGLYAPAGAYGAVGLLQRALTPPLPWPLPRPAGFFGLQWVAPEVDPYLQRGLGYGDDYDDVVSSHGPW